MGANDNLDESSVRNHGLAFFGAITASVTHELNNVMSIIEQTAGLLDDLCAGADQGRVIDNEKLREISGRVGHQVERGVTIIKRMNFFAHTVDEPVRTFELEILLQNLIDLAQRFAGLNKVRLDSDLPDLSTEVTTNPFVLEQAVFICLQRAIGAAPKDGQVVVASGSSAGSCLIQISGPVEGDQEKTEPGEWKLDLLKTLIGRIQGSLDISTENGDVNYLLTVPNISSEA